MTIKPFVEMTSADYDALGFRSGLEVHQQLLTSRKLFCRCPAGRYSRHFDAEILRHMRPTLSELGEYDGTALMEFKTKKEIVYRIHRETVCTYEMDDTPPFELNEEALEIALEIGQLYGCTMVDEIHIARKQYLDGSIPTGFQRTTIVGVNGSIPYKDRSIAIVQLGLEEDSCREVSDAGHLRTYLTDRLGMPLIETVTGPDMRTPQEVAEVAEIIRRAARANGRVRVGAGAARQDVNVSVSGGTRIEIKGVSSIRQIPILTYHEAMRQHRLLLLRDELQHRGITPQTFRTRSEDVTKILRKTRFQPIRDAVAAKLAVRAVRLEGFRDLLRWQTQTDTYFAREISDRVRVVACLTTLPNITHSDSPSDTLSSSEWMGVRKATGATDDDTVVLVWGPSPDVSTAAAEVALRAKEAAVGVPSETRQALRDGTNGFERILPGPDRMYPDTDLPPLPISRERLAIARAHTGQPYWERERWYGELGVPSDLRAPLASSPWADLFADAVRSWKLPPVQTAVFLIQLTKRVARARRTSVKFTTPTLRQLLLAVRDGLVTFEGLLPALHAVAERGSLQPEDLPGPCTMVELTDIIAQSRRDLAALKLRDPRNADTVLMGLVMHRVRGRVPGKTVASHIGSTVSETTT